MNYPNVHIIHGDSGVELPKIIQNCVSPITFWLDAHYCADNAEIGELWSPIKAELEAIGKHSIKNHIILIDDFRVMDNTHIDKITQKATGFPGKQKLFEQLEQINPKYTISFLDGCETNDVVVCQVI